MKSTEFVDFQWTDYEGLPMEDRFRIVEAYFNKGRNLFESNNKLAVDRFNNLYQYAVSKPVSDKKYIMVVLALVNNEVIVSQETQIVEFLSKHDNYYVVRLQDGREAEFPHKHIRDKLLMSIFLFDDLKKYDIFSMELAIMFDRGLPVFKEEDLMEDYQQFIPPKKMVWMVAFTPKADVSKQSATNRQTVRYFYEKEEDAQLEAQRLERKGHTVYTPVEVSIKNMSPMDKLREAMNPTNADAPGKTKTVYFVRQKRGDSWVRIAKYNYPLKAQRAIYDLEDSYAARGMEPPQFNVERVDDYPDTMYEAGQYTHNPAGLYNWRELERAVKHRASNPNDPGHVAKLRFGDQEIPFPKTGDMARLYKWVKNKLGNNKQREVFELLASPQLLNHLITSSRPPKGKLDESEEILQEQLLQAIQQKMGAALKQPVKSVVDAKTAIQVLYKVISNPTYLESVTFELKRSLKRQVSQIPNPKLVQVINSKWPQGRNLNDFFKALLLYALSKSAVAATNISTDTASDYIINQVVNIEKLVGSIISTAGGSILGVIKALGIADKLFFEILTYINSKIQNTSSKVLEGKKRKSRKSKAMPLVYGGFLGFGDSGDGGGESAMEDAEKDAATPTQPTKPEDKPKVELPPAHHAQKTQIPGTLPTYQKAYAMLNDWAPQGTTLDFGAGLGIGAKFMGSDTFEPYPKTGFQPTYTDSGKIKKNSYNRITNLNVLNVVPKDTRDNIVTEIGRILAPGGVAIITTRGKDVMGAKGEKGPESMSIITSIGTYQKGFTKAELKGYVESILGKGFEVESINLGPAGVAIRKLAAPLKKGKA